MSRYDRLSALISRFSLRVIPADQEHANLIVFENTLNALPCRILLSPRSSIEPDPGQHEAVLFCAWTEWGGSDNPLFAALPERVDLPVAGDNQMLMLVQLIRAEADAARCGASAVLNRLGEVLIVHLLRNQIEEGKTSVGLLGGLADARLSRAIVAIHEAPGKRWKNEDMASTAGLSISRFAELFLQRVGETPQAYLRRWRMILARQDVERGERIQTVARRYGYGSGEALNRAFHSQFGQAPIRLR
ncbi:MAG: AraC family transcriptional regulator [Gammaproteobacteria bacterium]|nr:AraC family transcriptional regulator [Gammaproteobacteria bacterium]